MELLLDILGIIGFFLLFFIPPLIIVLIVLAGGTSFSWIAELYQAWVARVEKLRLNVFNLQIEDFEIAKEISKTCGWGFVIYAVITLACGLIWTDNIYLGFSLFCLFLGVGFLNVSYISAIIAVVVWPLLMIYFIYDVGFSQELILLIDEISSSIIMLNGVRAVFYYRKLEKHRQEST